MYVSQLLKGYILLINIRNCELKPAGIELGNEETYEMSILERTMN